MHFYLKDDVKISSFIQLVGLWCFQLHPEWFSLAILAMEVNLVSAEFALRESLRKENSPLENLGKVHHTVKWQKKYFITFGLILQKASFDPKILKKNQLRHVFSK